MNRYAIAAALAVVCCTWAAALAEAPAPVAQINPPTGWAPAPDQSIKAATNIGNTHPLRGFSNQSGAQVWQSEPAGGLLFVSWVETAELVSQPAAAARGVLEWVKAIPAGAALDPADTKTLGWNERVAAGMAEATLEWQHVAYGTRTFARVLAYRRAKPDRVGFVMGECLVRDDAAAEQIDACRASLLTLAPALAAAGRATLGALPAPGAPEPSATTDSPAPAGDAGTAAPAIGAATSDSPVLYAGKTKKKSGWTSERWLLVIGGLLLIIAMYFTTRGASPRTDDEDDEPGANPPDDEPDANPSDDEPDANPSDDDSNEPEEEQP